MVYIWVATVLISLAGMFSVAVSLGTVIAEYENENLTPREAVRKLVSVVPWSVLFGLSVASNIYVVSLMYS